MRDENNPKIKLDEAIAAMRSEEPQSDAVRSASERVWQRLSQDIGASARSVETIQGCEDVRALLPDYQRGCLLPARVLLVEDHLHECAGCRSALERARPVKPWSQALPRVNRDLLGWRQYAFAATILVVAVLSSFFLYTRIFEVPAGSRARLESVNGTLYRVSANTENAAAVGAEFTEGEKIRTPNGTRAMVRLRDGSLVEMNERAEMFVSLTRKDTTIHLERGNIIVQAAKRRTGHLYVATKDCRVSVTGTVFSVNSGTKGSRVSVIEGEVRVAKAGVTDILHPGDQVSTSASVGAVPLREEIAWSQNLDQHLALLAEFSKLQNKLQAIPLPGLRYQSHLLPLLPAQTILYAGIPNLGEAVNEANQLFQQQLNESEVLRDWWQKGHGTEQGPTFAETIEKIHLLSQYLGDEIVFSAAGPESSQQNRPYRRRSPLIVAEVRSPGLKEFIENQLASSSDDPHRLVLQAYDEQTLTAAHEEYDDRPALNILVLPNLVVAAFNVSTLQAFEAELKEGGGGFATTPFGRRMSAEYQHGAGILFGANLEQIVRNTHMYSRKGGDNRLAFERTGFADLKYLIAERKDVAGQVSNHADLTFNGPRRGIASWLAPPAPMSGLDFVSPQAGAVAAFAVKNPADMLDDILNVAAAGGPRSQEELAKAESELKFRIREDLARTLGGEITFALDGPLLPIPSWKIIAEVYDPARLQSTLQQLVADINENAAQRNQKGLSLDQQRVDDRIYYTLVSQVPTVPFSLTYTFADGYMIMAANRALIQNALHGRQTGDTLMRSAAFRGMLPQDRHANVSALVYQNLSPVVAPIADQLTDAQRQSLGVLAAETKPSLVCAYGGENSIEVVSNSRFFGLDLNTFALSTLLRLTNPGTIRQ